MHNHILSKIMTPQCCLTCHIVYLGHIWKKNSTMHHSCAIYGAILAPSYTPVMINWAAGDITHGGSILRLCMRGLELPLPLCVCGAVDCGALIGTWIEAHISHRLPTGGEKEVGIQCQSPAHAHEEMGRKTAPQPQSRKTRESIRNRASKWLQK